MVLHSDEGDKLVAIGGVQGIKNLLVGSAIRDIAVTSDRLGV